VYTRQKPWSQMKRWERSFFVAMCALGAMPAGALIGLLCAILLTLVPGGAHVLGGTSEGLWALFGLGYFLSLLWIWRDATRLIRKVEAARSARTDASIS
jgi:hypothetical protein